MLIVSGVLLVVLWGVFGLCVAGAVALIVYVGSRP